MRISRKRRKAIQKRRNRENKFKNVLSQGTHLAVAGLLMYQVANPSLGQAMPQGGTVAAGQATIHQAGTTMTIAQQTAQAILNWRNFGIMPNEQVKFIQPGANAVALNRVLGNDPSAIYGTLSANGKVFLVNPNGVFFAPGAQVNVGGMVATTLSITDADFMNGNYNFKNNGSAQGVTNQGTLLAADGGMIALLAPDVQNEGIIVAKKGTVALAAGDQIALDYNGDGKIQLVVTPGAMQAAAANKGLIEADGGIVVMTARGNQAVTSSVVNQNGIVRARSLDDTAGAVTIDAADGQANIGGVIDVSGAAAQGGAADVFAKDIQLASTARLDASGDRGGGKVRVGGDWQGSGDAPHADQVIVAKGAAIHADAKQSGNGGTVAVWSDGKTKFDGIITAQGGAISGDGGKVETSGHVLQISEGQVSAAAANGKTGEWLLDPYDVEIGSAPGDDLTNGVYNPTEDFSKVDVANINAALDNGTSVTINTAGDGTMRAGDITVSKDVSISKRSGGDAKLNLNAVGKIFVNGKIESTAGKLDVNLSAANGASGGVIEVNNAIMTNGGAVKLYSDGNEGYVSSSTGTETVKIAGSVETKGGAITISGNHSSGKGIDVQSRGSLSSAGGKITLNGKSATGTGINIAGTVNTGTGDLSLNADSIKLDSAIAGSGTADVQRLTDGKISVGTGASDGLALEDIGTKLAGFNKIQIGGAHTTGMAVNNAAFTSDIVLASTGAIDVAGNLMATGKTIALSAGAVKGNGNITAGTLDLQSAGGAVALSGTHTVDKLKGDVSKISFVNAADLLVDGLKIKGDSAIKTTGGSLTINGIAASQKADITLEATTGDIDLAASGTTDSKAGNVTLKAGGGLKFSGGVIAGAKDVTLQAANFSGEGKSGGVINGTGLLTIDHSTPATGITIGTGGSNLNIADSAFTGDKAYFGSGFGGVVIGGATTGDIQVNGGVDVGSKLTVNSNGKVSFATDGALQTSGGKDLTINSPSIDFAGASKLRSTGTLLLNTDSLTNWLNANFTGSDGGKLVITPQTANKAITVGGDSESTQLAVTQAGLTQIAGGKFSAVTIGKAGSGGAVTVDSIGKTIGALVPQQLTVNGGAGKVAANAEVVNVAGQTLTFNLSSLTQDVNGKFMIGGTLALNKSGTGSGDFSLNTSGNEFGKLTANNVNKLSVFANSLGLGAVKAADDISFTIDQLTDVSGMVSTDKNLVIKTGANTININAAGTGDLSALNMKNDWLKKFFATGGITIGDLLYNGTINITDTHFNSPLYLYTAQTSGNAVNLGGTVYVGTVNPWQNMWITSYAASLPAGSQLFVKDLTLNLAAGLIGLAGKVNGTGNLSIIGPENGGDIYISDLVHTGSWVVPYTTLNSVLTGFKGFSLSGKEDIILESGLLEKSVKLTTDGSKGTSKGVIQIAGKVDIKGDDNLEVILNGKSFAVQDGQSLNLIGSGGKVAVAAENTVIGTDSVLDVGAGSLTLSTDRITNDKNDSKTNIIGSGVLKVQQLTNVPLDINVAGSGSGLAISTAQFNGGLFGSNFSSLILGNDAQNATVTVDGVTVDKNVTIQTGSGGTLNVGSNGLTITDGKAVTLRGNQIANTGVIAAGTGTINFYTNDFSGLQQVGSNAGVTGTGTLGIGTYDGTKKIYLGTGGTASDLQLENTFFSNVFDSNFGEYGIGSPNQTGEIHIKDAALKKNLTLTGQDIIFDGDLTLNDGSADKNLAINATGNVLQSTVASNASDDRPKNVATKIIAGDLILTGGTGQFYLNSDKNKISGKLSGDAMRVDVASDKLSVGKINAHGGAIILSADAMAFANDASLESLNKTSGQKGGLLTLQQLTAGHGMQIGGSDPGAGNGLYLPENLFDGRVALKGFDNNVYLGRIDGTGVVNVKGNLKFVDNTYIRSAGTNGSVHMDANSSITLADKSLTIQADDFTTDANASINAGSNKDSSNITLSVNDLTLNDSTVIKGKGDLTVETWSKANDVWYYLGGDGRGPGPGKGIWLKTTYFDSGTNSVFKEGFDTIILGNADAAGTLTQKGTVNFKDNVDIIQGKNNSSGGGYVVDSTDPIEINTNGKDYSVESKKTVFNNVTVNAGTGKISLNSDWLSMTGAYFVGQNGIAIDTYTPGTQINLSGTSGGLQLDNGWFAADGAFGRVTGGITLGSLDNTGGIHLSGDFVAKENLALLTKGNVTSDPNASVNLTGKELTVSGKDINVTGKLSDIGKLAATAADGAVKFDNANNTIATLDKITGQSVIVKDQGGLTIADKVTATAAGKDVHIETAGGELTIGTGGTVEAKHDVELIVKDSHFINHSGQDAIAAGNRWVIQTTDSLGDKYDGLLGDFRKYGIDDITKLTAADTTGSGSAHVHQPKAQLSAEKVYGQANIQFFTNGTFKLEIDDADKGIAREQADLAFLKDQSNTIFAAQKIPGSYGYGSDVQSNGNDGNKMNVNKDIAGVVGKNDLSYGTANTDPNKKITYLETANKLNYKVNVDFWVKPKEVTITAADDSVKFNQLNGGTYQGGVNNGQLNGTYGNGWSINGLVNGETIVNNGGKWASSIDGFLANKDKEIKYSGNSQSAAQIGTYELTLDSSSSPTANNYIFKIIPGQLKITDESGNVPLPPTPPTPNPPTPPTPDQPMPPTPDQPNPPTPDQPNPPTPDQPTPPTPDQPNPPNPPNPPTPDQPELRPLAPEAKTAVNTAQTATRQAAKSLPMQRDSNALQPSLELLQGIDPNQPMLNISGMVSIVDVVMTADYPKGNSQTRVQGRNVTQQLYADRHGFGILLDGTDTDYAPEHSKTKGAIPVLYTTQESLGTDNEQTLDGFYSINYTPERLTIETAAQGVTVPQRSEISPQLRQDYGMTYQDEELGSFQVANGNGILTIEPRDEQAIATVNQPEKAPQRAVLAAGVLRALQDFSMAPDQMRAIYIFRDKKVSSVLRRKG